jgi:hypothetical protein
VQYSDGVYVRAAAPEYAEVVGGKVVMVGAFTIDDAAMTASLTILQSSHQSR